MTERPFLVALERIDGDGAVMAIATVRIGPVLLRHVKLLKSYGTTRLGLPRRWRDAGGYTNLVDLDPDTENAVLTLLRDAYGEQQ